jgi:hypothetical protein
VRVEFCGERLRLRPQGPIVERPRRRAHARARARGARHSREKRRA